MWSFISQRMQIMIKYAHVINHMGSVRQIRYLYESFTLVDADGQGKGAGSADYKYPHDMADRGIVFKEIFKNGTKARSEAQEKKCLRYNRNSVTILFANTKGAVL